MVGLVVGLVLTTGPAVSWLLTGETEGPLPPPPQVATVALPDPARPLRTGPPAARPPAPPVRVRLPGLRVDAPVVGTGVDGHGGMEIPHDIKTIGWYRFGAPPGGVTGSAVLAGHVDDHDQGYGAFHRLGALRRGDPVQVVLADGSVVGYRVGTVERIGKAALPTGRLFARDGPPRLTLVTCGGVFDRAVGGYTDNVVVTATQDAR